MLTLKASVAAAILAGTAAISAGAGYLVTRATMRTDVAVSCPSTTSAPAAPARPDLPAGTVPNYKGKQW